MEPFKGGFHQCNVLFFFVFFFCFVFLKPLAKLLLTQVHSYHSVFCLLLVYPPYNRFWITLITHLNQTKVPRARVPLITCVLG